MNDRIPIESEHFSTGFTMTFDVLADRYDALTALVFGVVWRHCQMRKHVCTASVERMAKLIGVSENTVRRRLKVLVDDGFIIDDTPGLRHRPHVYRDSGKLRVVHSSETKAYMIDGPGAQDGDPDPDGERLPAEGDLDDAGDEVTQSGQPRLPREGNRLPREGNKDTIQHSMEDTIVDDGFSRNVEKAVQALESVGVSTVEQCEGLVQKYGPSGVLRTVQAVRASKKPIDNPAGWVIAVLERTKGAGPCPADEHGPGNGDIPEPGEGASKAERLRYQAWAGELEKAREKAREQSERLDPDNQYNHIQWE